MQSFDYAVIGAGPGGYVSAIRAAQLGLKTVLIDKNKALGGTCLRVGCIPSKALLESSEHFYQAQHHLAQHGVVTGKVKLDLEQMMKRKEEVVQTLTGGVALLMKKNKVTVLQGTGKLTGPGKIVVEQEDSSEEIEAKTIVLALGSVPVELPFLPFDGEQVVSSTEALSFDAVPQHLIVVGAGAVGLELGSVWSRLGAKVSVVEMLPQVASFADKQLATLLQRSLKAQRLDFHLEARVTDAKPLKKNMRLLFEDKEGKEQQLDGDRVLVAVGRRPLSDGLEEAGIKLTAKKQVAVDSHYRTNLDGVFAIGDLIEGPMLAHKAEDEGIAVAEIAAGKPGHVNYQAIPNVIYTSPELAVVGLTEEEAKEQDLQVRSGKFFFRGNGRALSRGDAEGIVKFVADASTDRLLGVHILGPHASELIAELVLALEFRASAEDVARTTHAHPTLSEAIKEAALAVEKRAIHA